MHFKGDIIITDPCYIMRKDSNHDDWDVCNYGNNMDVLGFTNYLTSGTEYGDWSCTTYDKDTHKILGSFCADAGLVSVFLLDEVLKYNPEFDYHINRLWTTTLIKDFDGDIEIGTSEYPKYYDEETEQVVHYSCVSVRGTGNINFYTTQTGL